MRKPFGWELREAARSWIGHLTDNQQEDGASAFQPQGTEFCEQLPHLRRGPRIHKETWPSQHFGAAL